MERTVLMRSAAVAVTALLAIACGGESPTGSSGGGVAVQGVVMGDSASASAADTRAPQAAQAKKMTVKVDGSATLSVDVNANGTFQLTGIPAGTFTLVFLADGVEVGRVVVSAGDGSEVKIVVQVTAGQLVVVEIKVDDGQGSNTGQPPAGSTCSVNGGTVGERIELEGNVASGNSASFDLNVNGRSGSPIKVNAASASYKCIGGAKTTSDAECKASVATGAKVHVSGTLMTCTASTAEVTATEVKVQKD
jgi:hypothetical protein